MCRYYQLSSVLSFELIHFICEQTEEDDVIRRVFAVFQEHDGLEAIAHKAMIMVHRVAHATTQFKRDSMRSLLHSAGPAKTFVGRDKRRRLQDFTDGRRPAYANFRCLHYIRPSQQRIFA